MLTFWDAVSDVERARTDLGRAFSRTFKLAREEWDMERVEWLVESLEDYAVALRVHLESNRGTQTVRERIALLRNTDGRTLEEAETFRAKADELERRLDK